MMKSLLALPCIVAVAGLAQAENLYKWVDENGVTVYSQTAPPAQQAEKIKPPPPPATDPQDARDELDNRTLKLDEAREEEAQRKQEAEQARARREQLDQACESAKRRRAQLSSGPPQYLLQESDGSTRRLSYEEVEKMRAEAAEQVEQYCGGN